MLTLGTYGDNLEMQALSDKLERPFHIFIDHSTGRFNY